VFRSVAIAALRNARLSWQPVCEVSSMEPMRATLEADLAVAPLLSHSIPESLEIITVNAACHACRCFESTSTRPVDRAQGYALFLLITSDEVSPRVGLIARESKCQFRCPLESVEHTYSEVAAVQQKHLAERAKLGCTVLETRLDRLSEGRVSAPASVRVEPNRYPARAAVGGHIGPQNYVKTS